MSEKALASQSDTITGTVENTGRDPESLTGVETMGVLQVLAETVGRSTVNANDTTL